MDEQERNGVGRGRGLVYEMEASAIDGHPKLRQDLIVVILLGPPAITLKPMI